MAQLTSLSTELGHQIVSYLSDTELRHMSLMNKHYRAQAESCLYRHLIFTYANRRKILKFLVALLNRKELALHIRSLKLFDEHELDFNNGQFGENDLEKILFANTKAIENTILAVSKKIPEGLISSSQWLQYCLFYHKRYSKQIGADAILAIILCLASNLKDFKFQDYFTHQCNHQHSIIRTMLNTCSWTNPDPMLIFPFRNLKALTIEEGLEVAVSVLPSIQHLTLYRTDDLLFRPRNVLHWVFPYHNMTSCLTSLTLLEITCNPDSFLQAITQRQLKSLKSFQAIRLMDWIVFPSKYWYEASMEDIGNAIVTYCPDLEVLEWSLDPDAVSYGKIKSFGSLAGLSHIRLLVLDIHLLIRLNFIFKGGYYSLSFLQDFLPQQVESVHITDITGFVVEQLEVHSWEKYRMAQTLDYATSFISTTSLRNIELFFTTELDAIEEHDALTDAYLSEFPVFLYTFLPQLVLLLDKKDITLRAHIREIRHRSTELLHEPGFEVDWPSWLSRHVYLDVYEYPNEEEGEGGNLD